MSDSKDQIMKATHRVLCRDGYSGLSVRKIAEEAEVDKSLIYHHYDSKKGLIISFLDCLGEKVDESYNRVISSPRDEILDKLLEDSFAPEKSERREMDKAFLEIQAHASHDQELSKKLAELDEKFLDKVEKIFDRLEVDEPRAAAEIYFSLVQGATNRKIATQDYEGLKSLREEIEGLVKDKISAN